MVTEERKQMKTVYIAEREYDREGFIILGVFETREEAEESIKRDEGRGDGHDIEEFILGDGEV